MKKYKSAVFHNKDVPGKEAACQIYAVSLQLIAASIISLKVTDTSKIGTEKISGNDLAMFCPNDKAVRIATVYCRPTMYVDDLWLGWEGFNLCSASKN